MGMSADDVAVGGHLERLKLRNVDLDSHYWITNRSDATTDKWAEGSGLRVIRYRNPDGRHEELEECVAGLTSHISVDEPTVNEPAIHLSKLSKSETGTEESVVDNERYSELTDDDLRLALNRRALEILGEDTEYSFEQYKRFTDKYDEEIYRAWYVTDKPGRNCLLGYTLQQKITTGSFGQVYKASDSSGNTLAIKFLRQEIRESPELLQCFRRGVRAMRILSEQEISGMVAYKESSEIPAFVVMDWIEGANCGQAVEAGRIDDWE